MADWAYIPSAPYDIRRVGPATLVTPLEDGTESRRQKASGIKRIFRGEYRLNKTDADAASDFYETNGLATAFSIVTYDPKDATDATTSVYFNAPIDVSIRSPGLNLYRIVAEFREV